VSGYSDIASGIHGQTPRRQRPRDLARLQAYQALKLAEKAHENTRDIAAADTRIKLEDAYRDKLLLREEAIRQAKAAQKTYTHKRLEDGNFKRPGRA
jgi:hypothetical protein